MRKGLFLTMVLVLSYALAISQARTITGKVIDGAGHPIDGASVVIKGTKTGTAADAQGNFRITAKTGDVLVISAVNFYPKEIKIETESQVNATLEIQENVMTEVVVTGLGIKREKKALGYAVSTINQKDVELKPEGDVGRLLEGKAPGVNVLNSSGLSGSGTNIVIRGISTINGGVSTPLFIVDGVPFDASTNTQSGFDFGNQTASRFLDLDPNEIESISILKGLSASVLYGDLARNGVILITTKNGSGRKTNKKLEIAVSQSYFANRVANLPEYQNSYGGGFELAPSLAFSNWGAHFNNPPDSFAHPYSRSDLNVAFPEYVGAKYAYQPYDNVKPFFRTGGVSTTSINVSGTSGNTTFNGSYSYTDDKGFTPGNEVFRNNFGLGGRTKLNDNFTMTSAVNFALTDYVSPTTGTSFGSSATYPSVFGDLIYTPRSIDLMGWPYENPLDHSTVYYRSNNGIQNPRWTVKNSLAHDHTVRTFGNFALQYDIPNVKGLSLLYKFGLDIYSELSTINVNKGGVSGGDQYIHGLYRTSNITNSILDHNLLAQYDNNINDNFSLHVDAGANLRIDNYRQNGMKSTQQLVYGLFNHANFINHESVGEDGSNLDFNSTQKRFGVFANATLGYKDYLYLNIGGRESWVSTLEESNRNIFYPSGSVSFIPTAAMESLKNSKVLNYLKLRIGYATSARFPDPYTTRTALQIYTNAFVDPFGNKINVNSVPNRLPNPDLKPELISETEAGVEGRFWDSRINLDLTLYNRVSKDQILDRQLDPSTGYTVTAVNAGQVSNKGIEVGLGLNVIKGKNWNWELDANYTLNKSKVSDLPDDIKQIVYAGYTNLGNAAINGEPLGVILGSRVSRDSTKGNALIVGSNGDYLTDPEIGIIGDPNPKYKLTGISTLSYKQISFRMQWDYTVGGDMLSLTTASLLARGLTKETDFDRTQPLVLPGVKEDGTPNDIQVSPTTLYFDKYFGPSEMEVWNATVIRLREISLAYTLPAKWLAKSPFGSISIVASGQNLFYYTPDFPHHIHFDPETSSLGVSNGRGLELLTGPSSKRYGASIKVTF